MKAFLALAALASIAAAATLSCFPNTVEFPSSPIFSNICYEMNATQSIRTWEFPVPAGQVNITLELNVTDAILIYTRMGPFDPSVTDVNATNPGDWDGGAGVRISNGRWPGYLPTFGYAGIAYLGFEAADAPAGTTVRFGLRLNPPTRSDITLANPALT